MTKDMQRRFWLIGLAAGIVALVLVAYVIIILPPLLVQPEAGLGAADRLSAENGVRTAGIAALVALGSAATAVYTARSYQLNRRTYRLQQQGQLADRYTKAIEQVGSDKSNVRIGGIYALEQTVHDNHQYGQTVRQVLSSYIRDRAPWPTNAPEPKRSPSRLYLPAASLSPRAALATTDPELDVQVALTVLCSIMKIASGSPLDLRGTNLSGADLMRMDLVGAQLQNANLTKASLIAADLTGADLRGAIMDHADLFEAILTTTIMRRGQLDNSQLMDAKESSVQWTDSPARLR
jgi:hypothetical protein